MRWIPFWLLMLSVEGFALECSFRSHEDLGRLVLSQLESQRCAPKKIHLTFDDGPHSIHTPLLLNELNKRGVKATFFVSTTNIAPERQAQRRIVSSAMDAGHAIGSHGHEHEAYDLRMNARNEVQNSLTPEEKIRQIRLSTSYLNEATGNRYFRQKPLLFRFPYGRGVLPSDAELVELERRGEIRFTSPDRKTRLKEYRASSVALHTISDAGYGHLLWNHDSMDSSTSAPGNDLTSKAKFIQKNIASLCSSSQTDIISLFHDIKPFNPGVVGVLIDLGQCLGLNFVDQKTILASQALADSGTFLSKEQIRGTPIRQLDEIGKILATLRPDCVEDQQLPGSCYSQSANRFYRDCESGEVSICIHGSWFKKTEEKLQECRARGL